MSQHRNDPEPNGLDDRFADWVDGRLDEQARRELEAELARDPELCRQAEEYRATVQMVREHLTTHLTHDEPPADLVTGVLQRVRRERSPLFRLVPVIASLSAAAALVLMVFLLNEWNRGADPLDNLNRSEEVARYEERDEPDQPDDMALKEAPRTKAAAGETKSAETLDRARRFKSEVDPMLAKKRREMEDRDAKQQAAVVETEEEQEVVEEAREQAQKGDVAKVSDQLRPSKAPSKAPAPGAPTEPALPGAGAEQRARTLRTRGRTGGRGGRGDRAGQADKDMGERAGIRRLEENQLTELRRITTQVFTARQPVADAKPTTPEPLAQRPSQTQAKTETQTKTEPAQDEYDRGAVALRPKLGAEKKNKADDTKLVAQMPVVVVQLAGPPVSGQGPGTDKRLRAVGGKPESRKGQQQVAHNFLGYLQKQPQSWGAGNQIHRQARAVDLTRTLAKPQDPAKPQTGGGAATAQAMLQPGDQLLLVTGSSQEVLALFQQLKVFFGKPKDVAVQQLPQAGLPGGFATLGARPYARKKPAEEMHFYLVLRDAAPATRPRAGRR